VQFLLSSNSISFLNDIFLNEPLRREEHEGREEKFCIEIVGIIPMFLAQPAPRSMFFCYRFSSLLKLRVLRVFAVRLKKSLLVTNRQIYHIALPGNLCFKIGITGQGFCSCKFSGLFQLKGPFFSADIHSKLFARVIATYSNLNSSAFFK